MRILIVDDDAALGSFLQKGLAVEGHDVHLVTNAGCALRFACDRSYDMIVLDLSADESGNHAVLEGLRHHSVDSSTLLLTSRSLSCERVAYLDGGADDVLLKPISFAELTARCRVVMRRRRRFADAVLRHGDLELHRIERRVTRRGRSVDLTVKEFALLEYLMLARGRICSRSELMREVWQHTSESGTNVVDVYVNYLRKKLTSGERTGGPTLPAEMVSSESVAAVIDTVRGEGYSLTMQGCRKQTGTVRSITEGMPMPAFAPALQARVFTPGELARA